MTLTGLQIATLAMNDINVNDPIDPPQQADIDFVLSKANRILDNWNADRRAIFADQFLDFTITPDLNPHTIGITGGSPTWTVTGNRPESIEGAVLILTGSAPNARSYMRKRDAQWWQNNTVPTVESQTPTDFFYNPTWPNGEFNMWPVPTQAYDVQLWVRGILSELTQAGSYNVPPGYMDALILTLAEDLCGAFEKPIPPMLPEKARRARDRVFSMNTRTPRLSTRDAGMPSRGSGTGLPDFNWYVGSIGNP